MGRDAREVKVEGEVGPERLRANRSTAMAGSDGRQRSDARRGRAACAGGSDYCQAAPRGYTCTLRTAARINTGSWGTPGLRGLRLAVLGQQFPALGPGLDLRPGVRAPD